jgi:hypothetical protein
VADRGQHVLALQRLAHVLDGQLAFQQGPGIDPESECQRTAAEQRHALHPLNPLQPFLHHLVHPAAEEQIAVAMVLRTEAEHHQQIVGAASHLQAQSSHRAGQLAQHLVGLVLGIDLIQLRIACREAEGDRAAVGTTAGADALQPFQSLELLLQQGRHPLLHHLRSTPGVAAAHGHPARGDRWQGLHLQTAEVQGAEQQHQQAQHQAEHGAAQEGIGEGAPRLLPGRRHRPAGLGVLSRPASRPGWA